MSAATDLLTRSSKAATKMFLLRGEIPNMILDIETEDGIRVPCIIETGGDKDAQAAEIRKLLKRSRAVRYALIMEAWFFDGTESGYDRHAATALHMVNQGVSLQHHPDRKEVVSISVEDRVTKECHRRNYQILRPEHGRPVLAPAKEWLNLELGEGRFARMFEEPPV